MWPGNRAAYEWQRGCDQTSIGTRDNTVVLQECNLGLVCYCLTVGSVPAILQAWPLHPLATSFCVGSDSR